MTNLFYYIVGFVTGQIVFAIIELLFEIRNMNKDTNDIIKSLEVLTKSIENANRQYHDVE